MNRSLLISIISHIVIIIFLCFGIGKVSKKSVQQNNFATFNFATIGKKSVAPVIKTTKVNASKVESQVQKKQSDKKVAEVKKEKQQNVAPKKIVLPNKKPVTNKKPILPSKKLTTKPVKDNKSMKKPSVVKKKAVVNLQKKEMHKNDSQVIAKKSLNNALDNVLIKNKDEKLGENAEEIGEVLTAAQIDLIKQRMKKCWNFPAGLKNAADLIVDIKIELDQNGNVIKAEIVDKARMSHDANFKIAAESAYRAVLDPIFTPLPLPKEKYSEWKCLELSFDPQDMMG